MAMTRVAAAAAMGERMSDWADEGGAARMLSEVFVSGGSWVSGLRWVGGASCAVEIGGAEKIEYPGTNSSLPAVSGILTRNRF